jgi:hypothetical protein
MNYLFPGPTAGGGVRQIRVKDEGSFRHYARVAVQGVEARGLVDTGADITIMGGDLFKKIATAARLLREQFKKPDRVPFTYDKKEFKLDGVMELTVSFGEKVTTTPVYIKMDAEDQLLLSEGLCRQLGVVTYHGEIEREASQQKDSAQIPIVRVKLVDSLRLLPKQSALARVELEDSRDVCGPVLMEANQELVEAGEIQLENTLMNQGEGKYTVVMFSNPFARKLEPGSWVGAVIEVGVVDSESPCVLDEPEEVGDAVKSPTVAQVKMTGEGATARSWRKSYKRKELTCHGREEANYSPTEA